MSRTRRVTGRRSSCFRRLLLFPFGCVLLGGLGPPAIGAQELRVLRRDIVIRQESVEDLRIVESLEILWPEGDPDALEALPLIRLVAEAADLRILGGEVAAQDIRRRDDGVLLLERPPAEARFSILLTYHLPIRRSTHRFVAPIPIDDLTLSIARTGIDVRPGEGLRPLAEEGGAAGFRQYAARDLPAGRSIELRLRDDRIDTRQRLAVLLATALLAGLVWIRVWRAGRAAP